jgi:hypothetical protein
MPIGRRGHRGGEGRIQPFRKCLILRASGEYANWQNGPGVFSGVGKEVRSPLENPYFLEHQGNMPIGRRGLGGGEGRIQGGFMTWSSDFSFTEFTPSLFVVFLDQGIHL